MIKGFGGKILNGTIPPKGIMGVGGNEISIGPGCWNTNFLV